MNKYIGKAVAVTTLLAAATVMLPAQAHTTSCSTGNTPTPGSTVMGNLEVASGNACNVNAIRVTGNVDVAAGALLSIQNSTIQGTLTTAKSDNIFVQNVTVGGAISLTEPVVAEFCQSTLQGNVSIRGGGGLGILLGDPTSSTPFGSSCAGNTIKGNISATGVDGELVIEDNRINGGVDVSGTMGSGNPVVTIEGNAISTNLSCSGNASVGIAGTNNVKGHESGQCKGF